MSYEPNEDEDDRATERQAEVCAQFLQGRFQQENAKSLEKQRVLFIIDVRYSFASPWENALRRKKIADLTDIHVHQLQTGDSLGFEVVDPSKQFDAIIHCSDQNVNFANLLENAELFLAPSGHFLFWGSHFPPELSLEAFQPHYLIEQLGEKWIALSTK
jgi:hypothetical protein